MNIEDNYFDIDIEADLVGISDTDEIFVEAEIEVEDDLPNVYIFLENLVLLEQVKGIVKDREYTELDIPAYAYADGEMTYVCHVELTAKNVMTMQSLLLKVTLHKKGKEVIKFDKAEHFIGIVKTLKESDTIDYSISDIPNTNDEYDEGSLRELLAPKEENEVASNQESE